ncbi:hypothetical protein HK103_004775 [Boothiomyces macroporosus]|uniref:Uncharacterized protein n=1 Tax=Boothiomyces macroporosus TaxID=261099 RepID=A0AAD5YB17_9FUNG|nr:hypothetical protein HK103_004775 [Boothiomyces macroporosus]
MKIDELYTDDEDDAPKAKLKPTTPVAKGKLISFDPVNIPKGDKSSIDKFISSRVVNHQEEVLVKYKVNLS